MGARRELEPGFTAQLRTSVQHAVETGDFDRAFGLIRDAVVHAGTISLERQIACFGSSDLDELCLRVGKSCLQWKESKRWFARAAVPGGPASLDIYIASQLYRSGGHTPLIGDFVRAAARPAVLLITNIEITTRKLERSILDRVGLPPSQVRVCKKQGLRDKFLWLTDLLDRYRPNRIFLFNHPQDAVAVAACQPRSGQRLVFVHHADRIPSVGAFLPFASHVDLTPFCFNCCRQLSAIAGNVFVPLVARDEGCRDFATPRAGFAGLRTASVGYGYKFRHDYAPNYVSVIAQLLRLTGGCHVHIGDLNEDYRDRFMSALKGIGVAPDRLIYIPHVPSVWRAMSELDIDLYIGSFPIRGARTSVEVIGSGTPAVWHVTDGRSLFHDTHMKYPEAATWRSPDELLAIVRRIDGDWIVRQSRAARSHYEHHHHPRILAPQLGHAEIPGHPVALASPGELNPRPTALDHLLA
jgi:hypothetical protein